MSRYDGLIIPRSYSEYLNKTDSATLSQMLQHLTGLWSHAVSAGDQKPVTSDAVYEALTDAATIQQALQLPGVLSGAVAAGDNKAVTSNAVNDALTRLLPKIIVESNGSNVMQDVGNILVNMGVTEKLDHLYLLHIIDKGDPTRRLSMIIDFQMNISDGHTILTQNGLTFFASNKFGTISVSGDTGQGLLYSATLLD